LRAVLLRVSVGPMSIPQIPTLPRKILHTANGHDAKGQKSQTLTKQASMNYFWGMDAYTCTKPI